SDLIATWISTSRKDNISGIRFYRIPPAYRDRSLPPTRRRAGRRVRERAEQAAVRRPGIAAANPAEPLADRRGDPRDPAIGGPGSSWRPGRRCRDEASRAA